VRSHAYVRNAEGGTNYLAELSSSGDEVQVVDTAGHTREAIVGRVKIEKRPMFRIQAEVETEEGIDRIETLIQNAETVKIATSEGRKAVTDLEEGDEALVYYEDVARHSARRLKRASSRSSGIEREIPYANGEAASRVVDRARRGLGGCSRP